MMKILLTVLVVLGLTGCATSQYDVVSHPQPRVIYVNPHSAWPHDPWRHHHHWHWTWAHRHGWGWHHPRHHQFQPQPVPPRNHNDQRRKIPDPINPRSEVHK